MTDDTLQRYFDGDLPSDEAAAFEVHVRQSPQAQQQLQSLAALRADLRQWAAAQPAADVGDDAAFEAIVQRLDAVPSPAPARLHSWRRSAGFGGLAMAAAVGLAWLNLRPAALPAQRGSTVTRAEFRDHPGVVFSLQGDRGQPIALVWIDERESDLTNSTTRTP